MLFRNTKFRTSLVFVIVSILALFGIEVSEIALNQAILNIIEAVALVATISGGIIAVNQATAPVQAAPTGDRSLIKLINDLDTKDYYAAALAQFNEQNNTTYQSWTEIQPADLLWHLTRYVMAKKA